MNNFNLQRALAAGIGGTTAMTMVMFMVPVMGMPKMDVAAMLAGFMGIPVALGWIAHFMIGIVLALTYGFAFARKIPDTTWTRGAIFSLIPWIMAQVLINPMMGAGFFATHTTEPMMIVMGSLLGHLVFGIVIGLIYGSGKNTIAQFSHS